MGSFKWPGDPTSSRCQKPSSSPCSNFRLTLTPYFIFHDISHVENQRSYGFMREASVQIAARPRIFDLATVFLAFFAPFCFLVVDLFAVSRVRYRLTQFELWTSFIWLTESWVGVNPNQSSEPLALPWRRRHLQAIAITTSILRHRLPKSGGLRDFGNRTSGGVCCLSSTSSSPLSP